MNFDILFEDENVSSDNVPQQQRAEYRTFMYLRSLRRMRSVEDPCQRMVSNRSNDICFFIQYPKLVRLMNASIHVCMPKHVPKHGTIGSLSLAFAWVDQPHIQMTFEMWFFAMLYTLTLVGVELPLIPQQVLDLAQAVTHSSSCSDSRLELLDTLLHEIKAQGFDASIVKCHGSSNAPGILKFRSSFLQLTGL